MDAKYFGSFMERCPVCQDHRLCRELDTDETWLYRNCLYCGSVFAVERTPAVRILTEPEIAEHFPQFQDIEKRKAPPQTPRRRR